MKGLFKKITGIQLIACVAIFLTAGNTKLVAYQSTITGEVMENPFFTGNDYSNWSFGGKWRTDGANDRLVFDVDGVNSGFPTAVGTGKDLTADVNITGNANYTTASNAFLTGFTFNGAFLDRAAEGNAGSNADYNLFFELDINTSSGNYRAKSTSINNPWEQAASTITPTFSWEGGSFLGDPQNASDGGIPLNTITSIQYKAVMQVVAANDNGAGTVFVLLDNLSLTYQIQFKSEISLTGSEGWRLISSPISGKTFDDFLGDIWTQGFTRADATSGISNVLSYNETIITGDKDSGYESTSDQSNTMGDGVGYAVYVFEDDDYGTGGVQGGFPKTLSSLGVPATADVGTVSFTYTSSTIVADDGWNLTGNPFGKTLNVDDLGFASISDLNNFVHVYRNGAFSALDAGGSSGETVAVGEGFFVKVTDAVDYTFPIASAPKAIPVESYAVKFSLSADDMVSNAIVRFHEKADFGIEAYDAYYLKSLESTYFGLSIIEENSRLSVTSLPLDFKGSYSTQLEVEGNKIGMLTLSWEAPEGLEEGWSYELLDSKTNLSYDLTEEGSLSFEYDGMGSDRFSLVTKTGSAVNNELEETPAKFSLEQNYPNPFNPTTNINYSVANTGKVTLSVYNLMGQKVAELVNTSQNVGNYTATWNAQGAASGMYYYRLESAGQVLTQKMTLIK